MPSSNVCWGIEVGSGAISVMKLEADGERLNVLEFAVLPHKRVLSTPDINQDDAVRVALGALVNQFDLSGARIAMSVPGHSAFARFAKLPPVEPKNVPKIVEFEAVQQIPFPLAEVEWDYQTFVSPDSPDIEVGIFAITRDRIMANLAMWQDVGIVPDIVTLSPVAAYNALAYDLAFDEKTPGTVILDVGTTSTDLVVSEPGRAWVRTFPIGGHHFTEAIAEAFKLTYAKAEKLKREAETTKHAKHVFQAMRPVFQDLAQDVQRSLGYYQSMHSDANLQRLIGVGSTFKLPGLRRYLKQQLQMNVYRVEEFKRLSVDAAREAELKALSINLVTAYGLALQGLDRASLVANLMPTAVAREAMWKRKTVWFGAAACLSAAASAALFIRPFMDNAEISANPPPPTIQQVVNRATDLKNQASDVVGGSVTNYLPANLLDTIESDHVLAYLLNDVALMLETAEAAARGGPKFELVSFDTEYQPPETDDYGDPLPDARPAVRAILRVSTARPVRDASGYLVDTIESWLHANRTRVGAPYDITQQSWRVVSGPAGERVEAPAGRETGRAGQPRVERGGEDPRGARPPGLRTPPGARQPAPPAPAGQLIGAGETPGGFGNAAGSQTLDNKAPIPEPPGENPDSLTVIEVTWTISLKPGQKGGEQ